MQAQQEHQKPFRNIQHFKSHLNHVGMQGMNEKNRNSELSYLLEVTQQVSGKTGSGNKK